MLNFYPIEAGISAHSKPNSIYQTNAYIYENQMKNI